MKMEDLVDFQIQEEIADILEKVYCQGLFKMKCKHVEENNQTNKCHDYYFSHKKTGTVIMCRLKEWRKKKKICPYDNSIRSCTARCKGQQELK